MSGLRKYGAIALIGLMFGQLPAAANTDIGAVQAYFRTDKLSRFETHAESVRPVYQPLAAYWRSVLQLRRGNLNAIAQVIETGESPYLQTAARRELLTYLIEKKDWRTFPAYAGDGDDCGGVLGALLRGDGDAQAVRDLWAADTRMRDDICRALYRRAQTAGILSDEDIWLKIRHMAGNSRLSETRRLLRAFPHYIRYQDVRKVVRRATRYIRGRHSLNTRARRELVITACLPPVVCRVTTTVS